MKCYAWYLLLVIGFVQCKGQPSFGSNYLKLEKEIALPGVKGRIDHMAVNLKDHVIYVAALGNNTVEVIDFTQGKIIRSIKGVDEPQGVVYLPEQNEIVVASGGNGDCVFFNASTFEKIAIVHLAGDADNIRYDAVAKKVYVGYGDGGIAMIDPVIHKKTGDVKLPAHPESFQLDKKNNKLYINLPNDHSIALIDLKRFELTGTWKIKQYGANFPMTLDTANNMLYIGYRHPALIVAYDSETGKEINSHKLVGDVDDIFYYAGKREIIASGGDGYIDVFLTESGQSFKQIDHIPTRSGARTALLIADLQTFILAERAVGGKSAVIAVYTIK